jgi:hypothetical protein
VLPVVISVVLPHVLGAPSEIVATHGIEFEDAQIVAVTLTFTLSPDERAVSIYGAFINPAAHDTRHKY